MALHPWCWSSNPSWTPSLSTTQLTSTSEHDTANLLDKTLIVCEEIEDGGSFADLTRFRRVCLAWNSIPINKSWPTPSSHSVSSLLRLCHPDSSSAPPPESRNLQLGHGRFDDDIVSSSSRIPATGDRSLEPGVRPRLIGDCREVASQSTLDWGLRLMWRVSPRLIGDCREVASQSALDWGPRLMWRVSPRLVGDCRERASQSALDWGPRLMWRVSPRLVGDYREVASQSALDWGLRLM
ncbi:hypothetical protein ACLB2K_007289 [Fragaria x ananassa]